jgi:hypothetical protein
MYVTNLTPGSECNSTGEERVRCHGDHHGRSCNRRRSARSPRGCDGGCAEEARERGILEDPPRHVRTRGVAVHVAFTSTHSLKSEKSEKQSADAILDTSLTRQAYISTLEP